MRRLLTYVGMHAGLRFGKVRVTDIYPYLTSPRRLEGILRI